MSTSIIEVVQIVAVAVAISLTAMVLVGAMKSGILRRIRFGAFEIEASAKEKDEARALISAVAMPDREPVPFETEQLAQYYAQVLAQSKISFWFSLVAASLGFSVIIIAVFINSGASAGATAAQIIAGLTMDAVAGLFFVQSKAAQTSMGEFFDKLRRDRQQVESRKLCDSISDNRARDAIKVHLTLHYASIGGADSISDAIIKATIVPGGPTLSLPQPQTETGSTKTHPELTSD